ncbi:hypothetical protein S40285_07383 [Stachybotrys chlorohalonatus IBT 40285]|uniref:Uncharacterized protein n=1 Tax=Stachybotrys chlorohalonatus (strain IBT 40285) TaxID=1283841 RepID=A0A084Q8J6_STAC4|nr:hypothetical protein S40285_07383 [Stachybotrys chlorohalonata IBT 40285]
MRRALNPRLAAQALTIKVSANLVVQTTALHSDPFKTAIDWQQVAEFALYGTIGSQVGNVFQYVLEDWFPNRSSTAVLPTVGDNIPTVGAAEKLPPVVLDEKKKTDEPVGPEVRSRRCWDVGSDLSWRNLLAKLVVDQTLGLVISGSIFLICTNAARVSSPAELVAIIRARIFPLIRAGWHIWPLIALLNFMFVPVRSRVLVAVIVGFGWSIFLSIFANRK